MNRKIAIAAALAAVTAATPVTATTYSFSYQTGAGLLTGTLDGTMLGDRNTFAIQAIRSLSLGGVARRVPHHRINLHGLFGVTSVVLGSSLDGSFQNFCVAKRADCSGVGFAVVTNFAPLDGVAFTAASDMFGGLFGTYLVKTWSIGPAGGVPEPANWAMLMTGFGLSGAMLRRRQRRLAN